MKYSALRGARPCFFSCSGEAGGRLVRTLIGAATLALLATMLLSIIDPTPAASAETTSLRSTVTVSGDVVTLGDFFENAGPLAERPLFRAPDLGTTGPVSAARVVEMAKAAGLAQAQAGGLVEVSVTRLSRPVEAAEISRLIAVEALRRPGRADDVSIEDLEVLFDGPVEPRLADVRSLEPVRLVSLTLTSQNGRFDALLQVDQGERNERVHLRGQVIETTSVTVLNRSLARGDIVSPEDVRVDRQPRIRSGLLRSIVDPSEIVGRQARRALRAGQAIAAADFARPLVVSRGETVTVVFRTKALQVTGRGQSLQAGAIGDMVPVLNPQSKRTIHATVVGPGLVEISSPATAVASIGKVVP